MRRPVFRAVSLRDTNAPWEAVVAGLATAPWTCFPASALGPKEPYPEGRLRIPLAWKGWPGLTGEGWLELHDLGGRVELSCQLRIKGWAVLFLLGWYRFQMDRLWPRFVASLPLPPERPS